MNTDGVLEMWSCSLRLHTCRLGSKFHSHLVSWSLGRLSNGEEVGAQFVACLLLPSRGVHAGPRGIWVGFCPSTSGFPCQYRSTKTRIERYRLNQNGSLCGQLRVLMWSGSNKTSSVHIDVTLRRVRVTIVTMEKQ